MVNGWIATWSGLKDLKIPNERVPEYTQEERQHDCRKHLVIRMKT